MYMTVVFCISAAIAGASGLLMPHLVFRLGFFMMLVYLGMAVLTVLLKLVRWIR